MVKAEIMTRAMLEHQHGLPVGLVDCLTERRANAERSEDGSDSGSHLVAEEVIEQGEPING